MSDNGLTLTPEQHRVIHAVTQEFFLRRDPDARQKGTRMLAEIEAKRASDRLVQEIASTLRQIGNAPAPALERPKSPELSALLAISST